MLEYDFNLINLFPYHIKAIHEFSTHEFVNGLYMVGNFIYKNFPGIERVFTHMRTLPPYCHSNFIPRVDILFMPGKKLVGG